MTLKMRFIFNSLVPVLLFLILVVVIYSFYSSDQSRLEISRLQNSAQITAEKIDNELYKISRAASEFTNRRYSIQDVITFAETGTLANVISAYSPSILLDVLISNTSDKALFRSWDALSYGDQLPFEQQGHFLPKIIEINGAKQFAVSLKILDQDNHYLGNVLVANKVNSEFLEDLRLTNSDNIQMGVGSIIVSQSKNFKNNHIHARVYLKSLPSMWIEIHSQNKGVTQEYFNKNKALRIMTIGFLICLILFSAFIGAFFVDKHILQPIMDIHSVIFNGAESEILSKLPSNEIGILGNALLNQQYEIILKNLQVEQVTKNLVEETNMVKILSHDLSTPITVIKFSGTQLYKMLDADNLKAIKALDTIIKQTRSLEATLSHVKEMKALQTGKQKLKLREILFGTMVNEISQTFSQKLGAKELKLIWLSTDEATTFVAEEISFFTSVFSNLLSNAIKFSERGSSIEVRCREIDGKTSFEMCDYGPGIPLSIREHLFSSNHQTTHVGSEGEKGTGFGMSLVKFYVLLYGASIEFTTKTKEESEIDHGTTFTILFNTKLSNVFEIT